MTPTTLTSIFMACLGSTLIGASAIFVRLSDLGPLTTGFYRMLFALPLLALWMGWERKEGLLQSTFPRKGGLILFAAGVFFAFDLALWNWSIDQTTIVNSTLFNNTAVFFVPLIMWALVGERQTQRFIISGITGFVGCLFLVGESISVSLTNLFGDIVAIASGVMVALYLIVLKRIRGEITTGFLMFWSCIFCLLFLTFFSVFSGESFWPLTFKDIISIFGQAVLVHTIGQGLMAYSLGKIPASYAALILLLAPLTAAVLGWIVYAEALSSIKILGMILIMGSIIVARKSA